MRKEGEGVDTPQTIDPAKLEALRKEFRSTSFDDLEERYGRSPSDPDVAAMKWLK